MRLIILPQALKISIPGHRQHLHRSLQGHDAGRLHRSARPDRAVERDPRLDRLERHLLGALHLHRRCCSSSSASACRRYSHLSGAQARDRSPLRRPLMSDTRHRTATSTAARCRSRDEVAIEITNMNKWYGTFHVLRDIDLTVYRGERIVICGPSGSGKSTLIRCINRAGGTPEGQDHRRRHRAVLRPQEHRQDPVRGRDGVPALQPVPAPDHPRELHPGADLGPQDPEEGGRGNGDALPREGEDPRAGATSIPASCRAVSSSAWPSRGRSACGRGSCCSTSRPRRSTPR